MNVVDRAGGYVVAVKENQPQLLRAIQILDATKRGNRALHAIRDRTIRITHHVYVCVHNPYRHPVLKVNILIARLAIVKNSHAWEIMGIGFTC